MKKRIMILGAGVFQIPLIRTASESGLETVVLGGGGSSSNTPLADHLLAIDTTNIEMVLRAAREYSVSAIVTAGTDVSVPAMAAVAEELNLPGPTRLMAAITSSKTSFREFQTNNGLNAPAFTRCLDGKDVLAFCAATRGEVVIKPDDSSGSRGVTILGEDRTPGKVAEAFSKAMGFSRSQVVCAESLLPGTEAGGEAFFSEGTLRFFTTTDKHMSGVVVQGHSMPGTHSASDETAVRDEIVRTAASLGYRDGPVNFDVMLCSGKASVIEMGLRSGGNGIVDLVHICHGVHLSRTLLAYALRQPLPGFDHSPVQTASSYVFGSDIAGTLRGVACPDGIKRLVPMVIDVIYAKKTGDHVEPFLHNANLVGYALIKCGAGDYNSHVAVLRRLLRVKVDP